MATRRHLPRPQRHRSGRAPVAMVVALVAVVAAVGLLVPIALGLVPGRSDAASDVSQPERIPVLPEPEQQWPDVVFLGDSYTEGAGSSTATRDRRWTTLLSQSREWDEQNLAVPGTGYAAGAEESRSFEFLVEEIAAASPQFVVLSGGRNDAWFEADVVGEAASRLFARLAVEVPEATVIVLSPWWDDDGPPESFTAAAQAIRDEAEAAGVRYVDTGQPLVGHPERVSRDGVHPNDEGHAVLADVVDAKLSSG